MCFPPGAPGPKGLQAAALLVLNVSFIEKKNDINVACMHRRASALFGLFVQFDVFKL